MRVLVCGSRTWRDVYTIEAALSRLVRACAIDGQNLTVIDGDANGADRIAGYWASRCAIRYAGQNVHVDRMAFPADWRQHGRAAGPIRNRRMLDEGRPDLALAFVDKPLDQSRGTAHMVRLARTAGISVEVAHGTGDPTAGEVFDLEANR